MLAPASAGAQTKDSPQPRIVGGHTADISQYPWQAAVVYSGSGNAHKRQFCGGSLITSRIVLTAGHCVFDTDPDCFLTCSLNDPGGDGTAKIDPNDVDVVLGRTTLSDTSQGAEVGVMATAYQSNYDGDYQNDGVPRFDAGYLVLNAPSSQPQIHMAGTDEGALWDPGSSVEISGWGTTSESATNTQDTLRAATVDVLNDSSCSSAYGSDYDPSTMLCAGFQSGGVDTCSGDSGGPLQAPVGGGVYRLVGITGWGDGCARANAPGVYTRVAGPTMRSLIESDVASLESQFGLSAETPGGSGATTRTTQLAANPFAKCKRIHNKKKRKRCVKKAKRRQATG
ncbi:MAG TPA: serine protease [Solirubrobacterales bacterium]|nr:serine protease [Solirubrobacterales bacterium]